MAQVSFELPDGLKIGDELQREIVLRELNAADIIEAAEESERLVMIPSHDPKLVSQPSLVSSPAQMSINVLCRQIKSIGSIPGPISKGLLGQLSAQDLEMIQIESERLDQATMGALETRGRSDPAEPEPE